MEGAILHKRDTSVEGWEEATDDRVRTYGGEVLSLNTPPVGTGVCGLMIPPKLRRADNAWQSAASALPADASPASRFVDCLRRAPDTLGQIRVYGTLIIQLQPLRICPAARVGNGQCDAVLV